MSEGAVGVWVCRYILRGRLASSGPRNAWLGMGESVTRILAASIVVIVGLAVSCGSESARPSDTTISSTVNTPKEAKSTDGRVPMDVIRGTAAEFGLTCSVNFEAEPAQDVLAEWERERSESLSEGSPVADEPYGRISAVLGELDPSTPVTDWVCKGNDRFGVSSYTSDKEEIAFNAHVDYDTGRDLVQALADTGVNLTERKTS